MFSGIIADIGRIKSAQDRNGGLRLTIDTEALGMEDEGIGTLGACL